MTELHLADYICSRRVSTTCPIFAPLQDVPGPEIKTAQPVLSARDWVKGGCAWSEESEALRPGQAVRRFRKWVEFGRPSSCEAHHKLTPGRSGSQTQTRTHRRLTHPENPTSLTGGSVHAPYQTKFPAEGPSLQTSLALNLDPAPDHSPSPTSLLPASRTGTNPSLFQLQSSLLSQSQPPPIRHSRHPVTMPVLLTAPVSFPCPSSRPTDTHLAPQLNSDGPVLNPAQNTPPPQLNPVCISCRRAALPSVRDSGEGVTPGR